MPKPMNDRTKTLKLRIYLAIGLLFIVYYCYSISDLSTVLLITAIATVIASLITALIVKFKLAFKNYPKGAGAIVFAFFLIYWKKVHAYSVNLEMTIALSVAILAVILSFKYSWSEWWTGKEDKESTEIANEK